MKKRSLYWALTIAFVILMILTVVNSCLHIIHIHIVNPPSQDDILEFSPLVDLVLAYISGIIFTGILLMCEYGIYSSLRYLLVEEKKGTGRIIWEISKLIISLIILAERVIAVNL